MRSCRPDDPTGRKLSSGARISFESGLGLLLIAFASESAHREESEGKFWKSVRWKSNGQARYFSSADSLLFDGNDQPRNLFKNGIESGARSFGLRHFFDEAGEGQNYFMTICVQFGLSREDVLKRLATWLSYGPTQKGVRDLRQRAGMKSPSFNNLWFKLRHGADPLVGLDELKRLLSSSPWVLPDWIDDLVRISEGRNDRDVETDRDLMTESRVQLLNLPAFVWQQPNPPYFKTSLGKLEEIHLTEVEYELWVAGSPVLRIVEDEEGFYRTTSNKEIVLSGFPRTVTAELKNARDEVVWTDVLKCWNPTPVVTLYKLPGGKPIKDGSVLDPRSNYALLVAQDFAVEPKCEFHVLADSRTVAYLLTPDNHAETRVMTNGMTVWRPVLPDRPATPEPKAFQRIAAETSSPRIQPETLVLEVRHPDDLRINRARILDHNYEPAPARRSTNFGPFHLPVERLVYPENEFDPPGRIEVIAQVEDAGGHSELVRRLVTCNGHGAAIRRGEIWDDIPAGGLSRLCIDQVTPPSFYIVPPCRRKHPIRTTRGNIYPSQAGKSLRGTGSR